MLFGKLLILSCCLPVLAFGQAISATVVGRVTDPSGAVVAKTRIVIRNQQTNQVRETITSNLGIYEFLYLPVGVYGITAEAPGFQRMEVSSFSLSVDQVARVDLTLVLGQTTDKIEVKAAATGLQTENATVGTVIDSRQVVDLPLNGRSFVQLAQLTPGVNPGTPGSISHAASSRVLGTIGRNVRQWGARHTESLLL